MANTSLLKKRTHQWHILAYLTLFIFTLSSCGKKEAVIEEPAARPVKMYTVGDNTAAGVLEYPGRVTPAQNTELAFESAGKITKFNFTEGQMVREGEIIASIDPRDFKAAHESAASKVRTSKIQLKRVKELFAKDFASQREVDTAERELEVFSAGLKQAEKALEETNLRAPFSGVFASKMVEDFANIQAKQIVGLLQAATRLHVVINVPENDFRYAKNNQQISNRRGEIQAQISVSAFPGRSFGASFHEISTSADPKTGTFRLTAAFTPPSDILILPGMTAKVTVTGRKNGKLGSKILIPTNAVFTKSEGTPQAWLIDPKSNTVRLVAITIGMPTGSEIEVTGGLKTGDTIAASGVQALREGMEVSRYVERGE